MVLTAVFATDGGFLTTGNPKLLLTHLAALVLVSVFTFGGSWVLYKVVDFVTPLRVDEHNEQLGLDLSQHGENYGFFDAAL
jgi:Amt family ammonium transporter